jgi:hypothetical protein
MNPSPLGETNSSLPAPLHARGGVNPIFRIKKGDYISPREDIILWKK